MILSHKFGVGVYVAIDFREYGLEYVFIKHWLRLHLLTSIALKLFYVFHFNSLLKKVFPYVDFAFGTYFSVLERVYFCFNAYLYRIHLILCFFKHHLLVFFYFNEKMASFSSFPFFFFYHLISPNNVMQSVSVSLCTFLNDWSSMLSLL